MASGTLKGRSWHSDGKWEALDVWVERSGEKIDMFTGLQVLSLFGFLLKSRSFGTGGLVAVLSCYGAQVFPELKFAKELFNRLRN